MSAEQIVAQLKLVQGKFQSFTAALNSERNPQRIVFLKGEIAKFAAEKARLQALLGDISDDQIRTLSRIVRIRQELTRLSQSDQGASLLGKRINAENREILLAELRFLEGQISEAQFKQAEIEAIERRDSLREIAAAPLQSTQAQLLEKLDAGLPFTTPIVSPSPTTLPFVIIDSVEYSLDEILEIRISENLSLGDQIATQ